MVAGDSRRSELRSEIRTGKRKLRVDLRISYQSWTKLIYVCSAGIPAYMCSQWRASRGERDTVSFSRMEESSLSWSLTPILEDQLEKVEVEDGGEKEYAAARGQGASLKY